MGFDVGIVGASGYGGAELVRLLDGHPELRATVLAAHAEAGRDVADVFPHLQDRGEFDPVDVARLAATDLVFVATPDGPSLDLVPKLVETGTKVVDLSAAFRVPADVWECFSGRAHPCPDATPAVYGLTEFARGDVAGATLVANPGCYVTTALLSLLPVADLLDLTTLVIDGKSGTSGAGRRLSEAMHVSHVTGTVAAYGSPGHRHTGEIEVHLARLGGVDRTTITFTPHLVPMVRGLLTTSVATLAERVAALGRAAALLHLIDFAEPFGLSVVEAMACGTPVIAHPLGSMPEIIEDGVNGALVADVEEAVAAVNRVAALDRAAVRASVAKRFSVERMVEDYLALYRRILAGKA